MTFERVTSGTSDILRVLLTILLGVLPVVRSDPASSVTPGVGNTREAEWWVQRWGLEDAWKVTEGSGVTVAVIDNGVQENIPDLVGAVLPGIDLTGAGTDGRTDLEVRSHGTGMASLIAARGVGQFGIIGVAPRAVILPVTLGRAGKFSDPGGLGTAAGIRWAVDHGAKIINMSYGADDLECTGELLRMVWYALDHDVILVAAAGNDGGESNRPGVPGSCPGVVAVGAIDNQGRPWAETQRQDYVDVAAPGVDIVVLDKRGDVNRVDGTSASAALVSGVVALLRARFPRMPARQIVTRLLSTAKDAGVPGKDDQTGYGIVRPLNALTADVPADAPNPVYEEVDRLRGSPTGPVVPTRGGGDDGSRLPLAIGVGGAAAVLVALLVLLARRPRRSGTAPPHPPGWGPPG
jgi:type VII secretion-associated serine protease mycosin